MPNPTDKQRAMAQDTLDAMAGPRCPDCGGCDMNLAPKWAGEQFGWCECPNEGVLADERAQAQFFAEYQNE